jgi:hypothetical protein
MTQSSASEAGGPLLRVVGDRASISTTSSPRRRFKLPVAHEKRG